MFGKGGDIQKNNHCHARCRIINLCLQRAAPGRCFPMNIPKAVLRLVIPDPLGFNRIGKETAPHLYFAKHLFSRKLQRFQRPHPGIDHQGVVIRVLPFDGKEGEDVTRKIAHRADGIEAPFWEAERDMAAGPFIAVQ